MATPIIGDTPVVAKVGVTLIRGDSASGNEDVPLCGKISAKVDGTDEQILFDKGEDNPVVVVPGNGLLLLRSQVTVLSSLTIVANLHNSVKKGEIAHGNAVFPIPIGDVKTSSKPIYGKDGEIKVTITWIPSV